MTQRLATSLTACLALCAPLACANEAPDVEATFGDTEGPPPDDTDSDTDAPEDYCVQGDGSLDPAVSSPVRYQCNGNGGGVLRWEQCGQADPPSLDCGIEGDNDVDVVFPPPQGGDPDLNAQICCESDLLNVPNGPEVAEEACIDDCARAACNEAIRLIQEEIDELEAGFGCTQACVDRSRAGLTTWRDFLVENYSDCLTAARSPGLEMILPNADIDLQVGAVYNGTLDLDCTITADPVESQDACSENFNPEESALEGSGWTCGVSGFATLEEGEKGRRTTTTTTVDGTMAFRVGDCGTDDDCWYQVNSLDLDADPVSGTDGALRWGVAELAYPLFGRYDTTTSVGTAPELMAGLDASVYVYPAGGRPAQYDLRVKNSKTGDVVLTAGSFEFKALVFEWSTGEVVTLEVDTTTCTKL